DMSGKVLSYSAPEDRVKRSSVDTTPIKTFLKKKFTYPLYGDDPRNLANHKIFSAAPIVVNGKEEGYLYVILHSESLDNVVDALKNSYIFRYSLIGLLSILILALATGLLLLHFPTKRLAALSFAMRNYLNNNDRSNRYPNEYISRDEIDSLGQNFNKMADKIDQQISELASNDAKRRELIASVSHDLRTPLTSMYGYLETLSLKGDSLSKQEQQNYIKIATDQSKRLIQLVSELFELSKLDSVETLLSIESFSLGELIQDVSQKFQLIAENKQISIVTHFGSNMPFAYGDIALIQRVLENLMDNAITHTPKGGTITLELNEQNENIRVIIADTGFGIAEEDLPHIFERFFHRDRTAVVDKQGTGLGLAIAKRIISLHGSTIEAHSRVNEGTTFLFNIPTHQPAI
ncbi:MAG: sensor histidine kinase, partial [Thiohalomonadales bacterium]